MNTEQNNEEGEKDFVEMSILLPEEQIEELDRIASESGETREALIRLAVDEYLEEWR